MWWARSATMAAVALRGKKLAMIAPVAAAAALDSPAASMEAKVSREERRRAVMLPRRCGRRCLCSDHCMQCALGTLLNQFDNTY